MTTLNLGIVAHVDAGKTTLTERLLFAAGAIDTIGSVDAGTTQTDSMALERQRGITIRAAVAAFTVDDVAVNLIDTPGHPDFIAEVERSLAVLDAAVLVVSAVEGVQSQTVVLMRALLRLRVPTLIFVNKVDRSGADPARVLAAIRHRLVPHPVPMGSVLGAGTRTAAFVAGDTTDESITAAMVGELPDDDDLLAAYLDNRRPNPSAEELFARLTAGTRIGQLHPVFFGSAATGAGIAALRAAFTILLTPAAGDPAAPVAGAVFKVDRGPAGEKVGYLRMFAGTVRVRDRLTYGADRESIVTGLDVYADGGPVAGSTVGPGQIARVRGLRDVHVGDGVGTARRADAAAVFAPPSLETAIVATDIAQRAALHSALGRLAEQDPLINLRQDDLRGELFVSLYGEVQKEVLAATLAAEFGIAVEFRETTVLCVERPTGTGRAVEWLGARSNPFLATVGVTIAPGPAGSGVQVLVTADLVTLPLYVYGTVDAFRRAMADHVRETLRQGLYGWQVVDCVVTVTDSGYTSPETGSADFRKLTPLLVMAALQQAGTAVCEPIQRIVVDAPADTLSAVLGLVARYRGIPVGTSVTDGYVRIDADVPAAELQQLRRQLHGRTHGEGVLEASFDHYQAVTGPVPSRPRSDLNPLNRKEYLLHVLRRV